MPTVEQLQVQYASNVAQGATQDSAALDQLSASAEGAAAAQAKLAASADVTDQKMRATGPSLETVANKVDGAAAAATRAESINRRYQASVDAVTQAVAQGTITIEQGGMMISRLSTLRDADLQKAQAYGAAIESKFTPALQAATAATGTLANAHGVVGAAADGAAMAHAGFTRELVVLGHEAITGNYSRIPGSMMVLAERSGNLNQIVQTGIGLFTGWSGVALGLTAAMGGVALAAANFSAQQQALNVSLAATGRTADISATSLQHYAQQLRQSGASGSEAMSVATAVGRDQNLTQSEAGQIVGLLPDLGAAIGGSVTDALKVLQPIADGSADSLQKLNDQLHFLTPAQEAAADAALQHGDKLGAMQIVIDNLTPHIDGLYQKSLTPLKLVLHDVTSAWDDFINAIASNDQVQHVVEGWAIILGSLANAMKGVSGADLSHQIVTLTNQQLGLQQQLPDLESSPLLSSQTKAAAIKSQIAGLDTQINSLIQRSQQMVTTLPDVVVTASAASGGGTGHSPQDQEALDLSRLAQTRAAGSQAGQIKTYTDEITKFQTALSALGPRTADNAALFDNLTNAISADQKSLAGLNKENDSISQKFDLENQKLQTQIDGANAVAAAWDQGADAVKRLEAQTKAQQEAETLAGKGHQATAQQVADLTDKYMRLSIAQQNAQAASQEFDQGQQLDYLKEEAATLGETADVRARDLAVFKEQQAIAKSLPDIDAQRKQTLLDNAAAIADATTQLQLQQQSAQALASVASNAFDQLGQGIVNAFMSGQGAAVSFGNVVKSVMASVVEQLAKLALINPLINSLGISGAQLLPTLGAALGGSTTGTGGASGSSGLSLDSLLSSGSKLFGAGSGSLSSSLDAFGARLLPSLFSPSTVNPTLLTSDLGGITAGAGDIGGTSALGAFGSFSNILGIAGAALPGLLSGNYAQAGAGLAGSAAGLAAGSAIGGTILGIGAGPLGLIAGGLLGNVAGSLISGPKPNPYSLTQIGIGSDGLLTQGVTQSQVSGSNADAVAQEIQQIDAALQALGVTIASVQTRLGTALPGGGIGAIGTEPNNPDHTGTNTVSDTVSDLFSSFGFASSDPTLNNFLAGKTFASVSDLQTAVQQFQQAQAAISTFLTTTAPQLEATATSGGSLAASIDQINQQFGAAITQAQGYIDAGTASADQVTQLTQAETDLAAARDKATQAAQDAAAAQVASLLGGFQGRYLTAQASITGNPADAQTAALYNFDQQAQQQRDQLSTQLTGLYGDAYKATADYASQIAQLERTLGEERLAIVQQYTAQAVSSAQSAFQQAQSALVTALNNQVSATQQQISATQANSTALHNAADSLGSFVRGLALSSASPLSPGDQLAAAQSQFASDAAAALAGNVTAAGSAQSDASALLAAGQKYYGSASAQYQALYASTVDSLNGIQQALQGQASAADQQLATLEQQLQVEQQQLATAQLVGTQMVQSIAQLNATMQAAFGALRAAIVAAGGSTGSAGLDPSQAAIVADYQTYLGRSPTSDELAAWVGQTGYYSQGYIDAAIANSPEAKAHAGMATGGWVGNGIWNRDSVLARFAGGGNIALAGGEFVVNAPMAARYADMLPAINSGRLANDNSSQALLAEVRALRAEVAQLRAGMADASQQTVAELQAGNSMTREQIRAAKLAAQRRA